jgi:hypothetical protein
MLHGLFSTGVHSVPQQMTGRSTAAELRLGALMLIGWGAFARGLFGLLARHELLEAAHLPAQHEPRGKDRCADKEERIYRAYSEPAEDFDGLAVDAIKIAHGVSIL